MSKRTAMVAVLALFAGLVFAASAHADSQVRIVRLSLVDGAVQVDRGDGWERAIMNMPITQGMKLSTPEDGRAEVEFESGTTVRLAPGSDVEFPTLSLRDSGARITTVQVNQGTAYFNFRHKGDDDFRVAFAGREVALNRNVHFRLDLSGGNPELAVFKGDLELQGPQGNIKIRKNETLALDLGSGGYDLAKNITPLSFDDWDNDRVNYASQYSSGSYNMNSPYYYGGSDLNYYGSWSSWPGYGMLWRPFGVGFGWDPFYNGAWAWYPNFGYTWVSTYPWGWTPYRYGSWVFIPNGGWFWRPGGWRTWYTVPPVYNAPPSFHGPKPPPAVMMTGPGGRPAPHPTVVVDNGVEVFRYPRPAPPGFVGGRPAERPVPGATVVGGGSAPVGTVTPSPAPAASMPTAGQRPEGRRFPPSRTAPPAAQVDRPHVDHPQTPTVRPVTPSDHAHNSGASGRSGGNMGAGRSAGVSGGSHAGGAPSVGRSGPPSGGHSSGGAAKPPR